MQRLKEIVGRVLPKGGFRWNVSVLAGGVALGQGIAVLAMPILTRLYSPEDFGNLQVYVSVITFGVLAVTLRYELAILLPTKDEYAAELLVATLIVVSAMTILFGGLAWWAQGSSFLPANMEALRYYLWLMPISICGAGVYQCLSYWALRQKAYSQVSATKLSQAISQIGIQLIGGFTNLGILGLLLGDAVGRMSGSVSLFRLTWLRKQDLFRTVRCSSMWNAAVRYRHFPIISTGSSLINAAGFAMPMLLMSKFYGAIVLGWFALDFRLMEAPSSLIGQTVSQVYMSEAAGLIQTNPTALRALFIKTLIRLLWLGVVPFMIVFVVAPHLFTYVFGESWREAGIYARLLIIMHYIGFAISPLTPTLNILEKQSWQFVWDIGRLGLTMGSLCVVYYCGMSARWAIFTFGAAMTTGYIMHLALSYLAIQKRRQNKLLI